MRKNEDCRVLCEQLENRVLLATAVWDGGPTGLGTGWNEPDNWVGDVLPTAGDDIVIDVPADPQIVLTGGVHSISSLVLKEALRIEAILELQGVADIDAPVSLLGGTISGGVWGATGSLRPLHGNNVIRDATIVGDISLDTFDAHVRIEGTTTYTTARLAADSTMLEFSDPGAVIPSDIVVEGSGLGTRTVHAGNSMTLPADVSITSGSDFNGSIQFTGTRTFINEGVIGIAGSMLQVVDVSARFFENKGAIVTRGTTTRIARVINTGTIRGVDGSLRFDEWWINTHGAVSITDGVLELSGDFTVADTNSISRSGDSTVLITGTVTGYGNSIALDASTGSWILHGGTVVGARLTTTDGERFRFGPEVTSTLRDVEFVGDVLLDEPESRLAIQGTTSFDVVRLAENGTMLLFEDEGAVPADVVFEGAGSGLRTISMLEEGSLTLPSGVFFRSGSEFNGSVRIGGSIGMNLEVNGGIDITSSSESRIEILTSAFVSTSMRVTGPDLHIVSGTFDNIGIVDIGQGTTVRIDLDGAPYLNRGGLYLSEDARIEVAGDAILAPTSIIRFEVAETVQRDAAHMQVAGNLEIDGFIEIVATSGWMLDCINIDCFSATSVRGSFIWETLPTVPSTHRASLEFPAAATSIRFIISTRADWNGDGVTDTSDFLLFLADLVDEDPLTDLDGNGTINSSDFLVFLGLFRSGC